ncbi:MAG: hypothetical protein DJ555_05655 [Desulfurococcaceae archaeon]|nr:MAG: hypothetical protein DJ555_05655 [Desulfurococcaceae archaeon]
MGYCGTGEEMRWLISSLVSSFSAIAMLYISWEFLGIPSIGVVFSDPRSLVSLYISILVPFLVLGYMLTHDLDARYKVISQDLKRLRSLVDAYQVVLNNINREVEDLKRSVESQYMQSINRSISSLEKRVSASEKLLSTIIELISSGK